MKSENQNNLLSELTEDEAAQLNGGWFCRWVYVTQWVCNWWGCGWRRVLAYRCF